MLETKLYCRCVATLYPPEDGPVPAPGSCTMTRQGLNKSDLRRHHLNAGRGALRAE